MIECHWWGKCPSTTQACTWDTAFDWNDCQSMHAICTRSAAGTCKWSHSKSYRHCSNKKHRAGPAAGEPAKNPDDPASPAVAGNNVRRWKANLLLKS